MKIGLRLIGVVKTATKNSQCNTYQVLSLIKAEGNDKVKLLNKLVFSNFKGMVSSVSVIFDTGATYPFYSNRGEFVEIEYNMLPRNLKGVVKGLDIYGFSIVEYSVRSESGRMISLWDHSYYVPGLPKDLRIIYPQILRTPEGYKGTCIAHCNDENDSYAENNLKEDNPS